MGDYVDINIYIHIYKICSSSMYINLSVSIMIPFGALIHCKYIYIYRHTMPRKGSRGVVSK